MNPYAEYVAAFIGILGFLAWFLLSMEFREERDAHEAATDKADGDEAQTVR